MTLRLATEDDRPDPVRDLTAFCAENIAAFAERDEPVSVALVVIGRNTAGALSWSVVPEKSVLEVCSASALLLFDRALKGG
jgi:hypothetical protein